MVLKLFLLILSCPILALSVNQEVLYLHSAKLGLDDPDGVLSSWIDGDDSPCKWFGVSCDVRSGSVISLDLSNTNVAGPFPVVLCRLKNLSFLSFFNNSMSSTIPDGLSGCQAMEHLDLSQNYLTGSLPDALAELPNLKYLGLSGNNFSGEIPASFGRFQRLEYLGLVSNMLDGTLPAFIGNVSSLKQLNLSYNPFYPGRIPPEFGNLSNLEVLWLSSTNLIGEIPDSLSRLTKLVDLDLAWNGLSGPVPSWLTDLTSAVQIELYNNSLTGELPAKGWSRMTALRLIDASMNQLTGNIPAGLCELPLESLNLYNNNFEGKLPESIANSPNLYELRLFSNNLNGSLPENLGKVSPLIMIDITDNDFTGGIPSSLCEMGVLEEVLLIHNSFSGEIPASLSHCHSLKRVRLMNNNLSGEIPGGFWGLPQLSLLELVNNSFTGQIAKTISGASKLSSLLLSNNRFSGPIPEEIGSLENLFEFMGNDNQFSGQLPASIVNLSQLGRFDLHNNELSGNLPNGIQHWRRLNELNLANNKLSGNIPLEIGNISVLNFLDLSGNRFSGKIPMELQNLKLNQLNLSNNHLSGNIPPLFAKQMYKDSFLGNPGLCDVHGLCNRRDGDKHYVWLVFVLCGLVLILGVGWFYSKYSSFKKAETANDRSKWILMSFHKLGFDEYEILDSLDEDNVIGRGLSGKVYKVVLSNGEAVAVKKILSNTKECGDIENGESSLGDDGFETEVAMLGKIRHKNIVKLWCSCITRDCKLLVYEYMPNGSLGDLLHSTKSGLLDWGLRYKIAIDAAEGLSYLHHDCVPPIVHRDVKSNNILLDGDFGARVADFGVAKVVERNDKGTKLMSGIAGSCGYIAPEYAYTLRVNEKSDIYSFGVVILELVTGRLPTDPEFGEKDLAKWVCTTLDQKGVDHLIDPKLDSCFKEEMFKVLSIGLLCTSPLPINRPSMRRVVKMLQEVSPATKPDKDVKPTPNHCDDASDHGSVA
ncbi:unnamed protein product [Cuscuta campestris]|uniref:non-specific serine/threonine protein kinase n=1 Tax=Cuscuta campestris TaxID=132261 RepID=A0A484MJ31_9ASTE|nr:unnamed protein product [Cuscuta campestris]